MTTLRVTSTVPSLLKRSTGVVVAKVGKYAVNRDELLNALN